MNAETLIEIPAIETPLNVDIANALNARVLAHHFGIARQADGSHATEVAKRLAALPPEARDELREALAPKLRDARARFDAEQQAAAESKAAAKQREAAAQRRADEAAKWQKFSEAGDAHVDAVREYEDALRVLVTKYALAQGTATALQASNPVPAELPTGLLVNAMRYAGAVALDGIASTAGTQLALYIAQHQPAGQ